MTRRKHTTVASFGPELLALLIRGSKERVEIPFEEAAQAHNLRHRLHFLRSSMRKEKHEYVDVVERAKLSVLETEGVKLRIEPNDSQFSTAIANAGINLDPPPASTKGKKGKPEVVIDPDDPLGGLKNPPSPLEPGTKT